MEEQGFVLSLNIAKYTNIMIPLEAIESADMDKMRSRIEIAKQLTAEFGSQEATAIEAQPSEPLQTTTVVSEPAVTPSSNAPQQLKIGVDTTAEVTISKYAGVDTSGKYPSYNFEVVYNGALSLLKASEKLHETLMRAPAGIPVKISKVRRSNAQGREYQTYVVTDTDNNVI